MVVLHYIQKKHWGELGGFLLPLLFILSSSCSLPLHKSAEEKSQLADSNTHVDLKKSNDGPALSRRRPDAVPPPVLNRPTRGETQETQLKSIGDWVIRVHSKEQAVMTSLSGKQILNIQGPSLSVMLLSVEYFPVNLLLVKNKIKEWGGDKSSLRVKKINDILVYSFLVDEHIHWFSSSGSYLMATVTNLNQKRYLSFLKRVSLKTEKDDV